MPRRVAVQSVLIARTESLAHALAIVARMGRSTRKLHETEHFFRFRQFSPTRCKPKSFRTKASGPVRLVLCTLADRPRRR